MAARVNPTLGAHQSKASESPEHVSIYFNIETYVDLGIPHLKKPPVGTMNSVSQPHIKNMKKLYFSIIEHGNGEKNWEWQKHFQMDRHYGFSVAIFAYQRVM